MIYVLAYPKFSASAAAKISAFRKQHEPIKAELVPPHITLVFGSNDAHLEAIEDLVDAVSLQTSKFTVSFDTWVAEYDPFEKKHKVFLVCAVGRENVVELHTRLYEGPHHSDLDPTHPYRPHLTIATKDSRAEIEHLDMTIAEELPLTAELRSLELVHVSDGRLTLLKSASLLDRD